MKNELLSAIMVSEIEIDDYVDEEGDYNLSFYYEPPTYTVFENIYNTCKDSEFILKQEILKQLNLIDVIKKLGVSI